ncbi:MAG TPA: RNA polymerase sigma factor [Gammaproteobacteria bacterium]|nr:RNA polymerase sigma factor [Gammaproteobacteria bacterium]
MFGHYNKSKQFRHDLEALWEHLYRLSYSLCHEEYLAADLVQSTIETALVNRHKIPDADSLKRWSFKVLVNKWRDHCRTHKYHSDVDDENNLSYPDTPESNSQLKEEVRRIHAAMSKLKEEHREVLSLIAIEGFSYGQVANILDLPIGTVMSRLYRSRKSLREYLSISETKKKRSSSNIRSIK